MICPGGFHTCTTTLAARERFRKNNTDGEPILRLSFHLFLTHSISIALVRNNRKDASPGYFTQTLDNDIKIEATSTRRAGLERFTFPKGSKSFLVLDLSNDLPMSFGGGTMDIDPTSGRVTIGGLWQPRFAMKLVQTSCPST